MRPVFILSLLLFSSLLSGSSNIEPYLTSENDTMSLVEGVVNAYNGKLVQIDKDIKMEGTDPLDLMRYYDGGHHFLSQYGYGVGFGFPILLVLDPNSKKQNVIVEQRSGSYIVFNAPKQKDKRYVGKIDPDLFKFGYTNCCEALLRGEPDFAAMRVEGTDEEFVFDLGNGTKRRYTFFYKDSAKCRYYRLVSEELPSGNRRFFSYIDDHSVTLQKIWTTNKNNASSLNWLNFTYGKDTYVIKASNGLETHYPDGTVKSFAYNLHGHLIKRWERDGILVTFDVDYKGRPQIEKTFSLNGELLKTIHRQYKGSNLVEEIL